MKKPNGWQMYLIYVLRELSSFLRNLDGLPLSDVLRNEDLLYGSRDDRILDVGYAMHIHSRCNECSGMEHKDDSNSSEEDNNPNSMVTNKAHKDKAPTTNRISLDDTHK